MRREVCVGVYADDEIVFDDDCGVNLSERSDYAARTESMYH